MVVKAIDDACRPTVIAERWADAIPLMHDAFMVIRASRRRITRGHQTRHQLLLPSPRSPYYHHILLSPVGCQ